MKVPEPRKRCYGGKGGTFVRSKRRALHIKTTGFAATEVPAVTPSPVESQVGEEECKRKCDPKEEKSILWDDVRCRPIYIEPQDVAKVSDDGSDTKTDDATDEASMKSEETVDYRKEDDPEPKDDKSARLVDGVAMTPEHSIKSPSNKVSTISRKARREHRPYGSVKYLCSTPIISPHVNKTFAFSTPTFNERSICVGSTTKESDYRIQDNEVKSMKRRGSDGKRSTKRCRRKLKTMYDAADKEEVRFTKSTLSDSLEFVEENLTPPGSNTSPTSAKAYFDRLDSTQKLKVDNTMDCPRKGSKCVRTSRRVPIISSHLLHEYRGYSRATRDSGVEPLSLEQYAKNRTEFFRTGDVFDGFLDT